jgi:DNA-directed RNA polymerase subunit RPC12/RpoP
VLDDRAAGDLTVKGRCCVQLVGSELATLQGPWIERGDFLAALSNGGPSKAMPIVEALPNGPSSEQVARVLEMHADGASKRSIQRAVFGYEGGAAYNQVSDIIAQGGTIGTGTTKGGDLGASDDDGESAVGSTTVEFCDFCGRSIDDAPAGVTFSSCAACGVGVCSDDTDDGGRCPDCREAGYTVRCAICGIEVDAAKVDRWHRCLDCTEGGE